MKKRSIVRLLPLVFLIVILSMTLLSCNKNEGSNDKAQKSKGRNITVINDTQQVINEVHITVGDGTELEHAYRKNPNETSFSIEISKHYNKYDEFTVTLVDRYENEYKKTISGVPKEGRTEVKISADDITKEPSAWKKFEMWLNND